MGRHEEEAEAERRHGRHKASPSPINDEETEEAIRNKIRESGWKKRRAESERTADAEASKDQDKSENRAEKSDPRPSDEHRSSRPSRSTRRSRSPRRRDRERRSSRRKSSGSRRMSPSRSHSRSRTRSRSAGRRRRRHSTSSRKRRSSSRSRDARDSKRSRRSSRSKSTEKKEVKEETKPKDEDETESEVEGAVKEKENGQKPEDTEKKDEKNEKEERHRHSSSRKSRRSRSDSPRSPSRASRRRRHRRNSSYSRSRSPSRSRRSRRGGSRSRSRGRDRDRERRSRRRRSYSRSRSPSYRSRRRRNRSSSRDRPRRESKRSPEPNKQPPTTEAPTATAPAAAPTGVNPTITQLMAQYPMMSLQDIIAKMQASNVTMAAAVAQKPARELYVGNLPSSVTGPQLQEFLSTIIQQVGLTTQPGNPIINTWISTDGHFAFCEMRSVEECNLALLLNQLSLLGQPLKFGRPRSFMGPPQPMPVVSARTQTALSNLGCAPNPAWFAQPSLGDSNTETTLEEATLSAVAASQSTTVGTTEAGSGHGLIMSNIPVVLTEEQVKELVEPFGALKSFTLVKDTATGASLGSAFFEYEDDDVASQASEGLNGLSIGGILLSVQRRPRSSVAAVAAVPAATANVEDQPSPVLKMTNMVSIDELKDDEEYADLAEDVEEECKRFGDVTGLEIPRPKDGDDVPGLGCIYVRFGKEEDAVSALKALNGRKFGGNIVKVTYFPLDKFETNDLS